MPPNQQSCAPMNLRPKALAAASLQALVVFVVIEVLLEHFSAAVIGVSPKNYLGSATVNARFAFVYYLLIALGLTLLLGLYAVIRPRFQSRRNAGLVVGGFAMLHSLLLTTQFLNLGLIPIELFALSVAFNAIELPVALYVGILAYPDGQ